MDSTIDLLNNWVQLDHWKALTVMGGHFGYNLLSRWVSVFITVWGGEKETYFSRLLPNCPPLS